MKIFSTNIFWNIYHPGILAGTTRLLVTHNPAVLQFMDSVVVVKSGEIVDQGSYSDLVARGGLAGLLAEGGQQEGVDGEEGEKKEVVKKEDGPLVETETDSARLTEDEEALTGKVSELLYRKDLRPSLFCCRFAGLFTCNTYVPSVLLSSASTSSCILSLRA